MIRIFGTILLLSSFEVLARTKDRPYFVLERFSLQVAKFTCNRDLLTPSLECTDYKGRVATNFDLELFKHAFWRNEIHGEGTHAAFTTVGWHWEFGFKLSPQVEIFHEHHSRHIMDRNLPTYWNERTQTLKETKFPVEDSYGVRIIFYEKKK